MRTSTPDRTAPTARGRQRRERIIDAATALFDERGFHATSMDDLGAAAGISGPGLYRHVGSKDDLLTAVFDRIWARLRPGVERADGAPPEQALTDLVDAHLDLAVEDAAALRLLQRELRHVPEEYRRLARRNHARYVRAWSAPIAELRPELDEVSARTIARAAHGLIDAIVLQRLSTARARAVRPVIRELALRAVLVDER